MLSSPLPRPSPPAPPWTSCESTWPSTSAVSPSDRFVVSALLCDSAVAPVRPLLSRHLQHLRLDPLLATSHPHALRLVWRLCVLDGMTCVVVRHVRRVSGVWMVLSRRLDSSSRRSLVSSDSSFGLTGGLRALWDPLQGCLGTLRLSVISAITQRSANVVFGGCL